jgi:hypothetical protein
MASRTPDRSFPIAREGTLAGAAGVEVVHVVGGGLYRACWGSGSHHSISTKKVTEGCPACAAAGVGSYGPSTGEKIQHFFLGSSGG